MLVDATLLTKDEIQNEGDERTTLALVIVKANPSVNGT